MTFKESFAKKVKTAAEALVVENLPAKVLCFTLALVLHFFYQIISLEHQTLTVPVTVKAEGLVVPAEPWEETVKVILDGKRGELAGVADWDVQAVLDVSFVTTEGEQRVPVRVILGQMLSHLDTLGVKVVPDSMLMTLEKRVTVQVPLEAAFQGRPAQGFDLSRVTVMPSTVEVTGPRTMAETLESVSTETIALDGRTASFTAQVGLLPPAGVLRMSEAARATVVTVAVILAERTVTTRFTVGLAAANLLPGLVLTAAPGEMVVELGGGQSTLARVRPQDLRAFLDCSGVTGPGETTVPVNFLPPPLLTVVSRSLNTAAVTVSAERE